MQKIKYCVVILTHGRAKNQKTVKALRRAGYTGEIILVVDDTDDQLDDYLRLPDVTVKVFSLEGEIARQIDVGDNFSRTHKVGRKGTPVFARNACWQIVRDAGYRYHVVMDDDYTAFNVRINDNGEYCTSRIRRNLDKFFEVSFRALIDTGITCLAWAQGGDFIGGRENPKAKGTKPWRKVMNLYFMDTDKAFYFPARLNDDLTASIAEGQKGNILMTTPLVSCNQTTTQKNKGGLTDLYLEAGTYIKSMYSVLHVPSAVEIREMGDKHMRIHHSVKWGHCVPMIIREEWKK